MCLQQCAQWFAGERKGPLTASINPKLICVCSSYFLFCEEYHHQSCSRHISTPNDCWSDAVGIDRTSL